MFDDVGEKISLDEFIKQFTVDELIDFVGGHQNQPGVCNTGAFGGLKRLGIPPLPTRTAPQPASERSDGRIHHGMALRHAPRLHMEHRAYPRGRRRGRSGA